MDGNMEAMRGARIVVAVALILSAIMPVHAEAQHYEKIDLHLPDEMKFQPVDVQVSFEKFCAGKDEMRHSIRVLYNGREIESQIYDIQFKGNDDIGSCNVVFLYQGEGEYLVAYGDEMREITYPDHVEVTDSYYAIEPLPGYSATLNYYGIWEDGNILFGICQEGHIFHVEMGNKVIKVKDGADSFKMSNWAQTFSFALFHSNGAETGSDERLVGKKILVDGNLMARVALETSSRDGKLETKATYTYYYSPANEKRVFVRLHHEARESWRGNATYAYIAFIKSKSRAVEELNMGTIFPYTHFNGEMGVEEYAIDTNPESKEFRWIIPSTDNVRLGTPAWISVDNRKDAYAFVFSESGLTVSAGVREEVGIPGLEIDGGGVSLGEYGPIERGVRYDGLVELFIGGYKHMEREVSAFTSFQPFRNGFELGEVEEEGEKHNLTVRVHLRHTIPFSPYLATLTGLPVPFIEIELWNERLVAQDAVTFRTASFEIPEGNYVVKAYRHGVKKKTFIGVQSLDFKDDATLHLFCTFQGMLHVAAPEGSTIVVLKDGGIVTRESMDAPEISIPLPALATYTVQVLYRGFLMDETSFFLPFSRSLSFDFDIYDFRVMVKDTLGMVVGVNLTLLLTSDDMQEEAFIIPVKHGDAFCFCDLPEGTYTIIARYKGFEMKKEVSIPAASSIELTFPAEYTVKVHTFDRRGFPISSRVVFVRNGVECEGDALPPASYEMRVYDGTKIVARKLITVSSNVAYDVVTTKSAIYPYVVPALVALLLFFRRNVEGLCALLLSFSLVFSWWRLKGGTTTNLYLFPPKMIEMDASSGTIISLPSVVHMALMLVLVLLCTAVVLLLMERYAAYGMVPLSIAVVAFIMLLVVFGDITVGSAWGSGTVDGVHATWGPGLGFYAALVSLMVMMGKMVMKFRVKQRET